MNELANQVAVVTGAGRGIGQAIALKLAAAGADIACVDLKLDGLDQSGTLLGQPSPRDWVFCHFPHGGAGAEERIRWLGSGQGPWLGFPDRKDARTGSSWRVVDRMLLTGRNGVRGRKRNCGSL